jgi:predicted lipoprotein with Yx(FWY)xxD motif
MVTRKVESRRAVGIRLWVAVAVLELFAAGCSSSGTVSTVRLRTDYFLQVHTTVLANHAGFALYLFVPDQRRAVTCTGTCAEVWPPLRTSSPARVALGPGVQARLVGSLPDPAGGRVVTYAGWPLYTYQSDTQPGIAVGQATDLNGGYWYLLRPDGSPLAPPGNPPAS